MTVLIIHSRFNNRITEVVLKPDNNHNQGSIKISMNGKENGEKFRHKLFKKFMK